MARITNIKKVKPEKNRAIRIRYDVSVNEDDRTLFINGMKKVVLIDENGLETDEIKARITDVDKEKNTITAVTPGGMELIFDIAKFIVEYLPVLEALWFAIKELWDKHVKKD